MGLKTLIIDDEALARLRLKNLIKDVQELNLLGECSNGKEAIEKINSTKPQLLFLDIQMTDMTGFDVLQKISVKPKPLVVFVTAYNEYALKAFDFFAFDYLLKPYKDERFFKSVENILKHVDDNDFNPFEDKLESLVKYIKTNNTQPQKKHLEKLPIKLGNKVFFIKAEEIKYISASGYYAEIFNSEKKYLLRESLSNLVETLNPEVFIRIHRSTIININEVSELIHSNYGEIDVKMNDSQQFRISKSYKKEFLTKMGL